MRLIESPKSNHLKQLGLQMRRSGLDKKLEDIIEFVYIDAPHAATGPPPPDVAPFFEPPYREWWNMREVGFPLFTRACCMGHLHAAFC